MRLAPSLPSLRESPLSGPRAGGNRDPQPLALPKSHPTRQPLSTADSAVGTSLVVRRAAAAQRARAALAEEGSPSRAGQEGEEGEAGWRRLRAAGRAKRKGAGEGRARSCANCRRQRRRSGHCTTSLSHSFRHCEGCRGCYCGVRGAERGRCPVWTQEREGWRTGGEEDWRRAPAATDGGASGRGCGPGSEKGRKPFCQQAPTFNTSGVWLSTVLHRRASVSLCAARLRLHGKIRNDAELSPPKPSACVRGILKY